MTIRTYRDLEVFKESYAAALDAKRLSAPEFKRYLQVAIGSCDEAKLWLEMGRDEDYIAADDFRLQRERYNRIGAMVASLWKNWQNSRK
jgi:four helix bundle protein